MQYDEEIIEDVVEDLKESECDRLVMFILYARERPVLKTRMQKESLIFNQAYTSKKNHEPYYFGGYSDDIDESYSTLSDTGIIDNSSKGMTLTNFGNAVVHHMVERDVDKKTREGTMMMEKAIRMIDDRSLVAITYHLFSSLADRSTIKESIQPLIETMTLNDKPLKQWNKEEFLDCIRNGIILKPGKVAT